MTRVLDTRTTIFLVLLAAAAVIVPAMNLEGEERAVAERENPHEAPDQVDREREEREAEILAEERDREARQVEPGPGLGDQEAAEDELLSRLVALNRERRAEEARGQIRWLRPAYQVPKLKGRVPDGEQAALQIEAPAGLPEPRPWPKAPLAQLSETRALLSEADGPLSADALARAFTGRVTAKRRERVEEVLAALSDLGLVRHEGGTGYLARR